MYANLRNLEHSFLKLDLWPYVIPSGNPSLSKTLFEVFLFIVIVLELWIGLFFFLSSSSAISLTILSLSSESTFWIHSRTFALDLSENFWISSEIDFLLSSYAFANSSIDLVSVFLQVSTNLSFSISSMYCLCFIRCTLKWS